VELLVAMIVGLFLVAGVLGLFITNKGVYTTTTRATELQENGRFALGYLLNDLRHAYFFGGKHFDSFALAADNESPNNENVDNNCNGENAVFNVNDSSEQPSAPLRGATATSTDAIGCIGDARVVNGIPSDILILKLVRPAPLYSSNDLTFGSVYVASNRISGVLRLFTADTVMPSLSDSCKGRTEECLPYGAYWQYQFRAYYIRQPQNDREPPALARMILSWDATRGMEVVAENLVEGVEGLRLLYGVQTGNEAASFHAAENVSDWNDVVSVQIHLLLRNTLPDYSYHDLGSYNMGDTDVNATQGTAQSQGAMLRNFHRSAISTTVMLRNKPMIQN
jgi:type IV pilus assembly protein PilW